MKKLLTTLLVLLLYAGSASAVTWNDESPSQDDTGSSGFEKTQENFTYSKALIDKTHTGHTSSSVSSAVITGPLQFVTSTTSLAALDSEVGDFAWIFGTTDLYGKSYTGWENFSNASTAGVSGYQGGITGTFITGQLTVTGINGITVTMLNSNPKTILVGPDLKSDTAFLYPNRKISHRMNSWGVHDANPPQVTYLDPDSNITVKVYDFDTSVRERIVNDFVIPANFDTSQDIKLELWAGPTSAASGVAEWTLYYAPCQATVTSCTVQSSVITTVFPASSTNTLISNTFTMAAANISDGDVVPMTIGRTVGGNDDYAADARIFSLILHGMAKNAAATLSW